MPLDRAISGETFRTATGIPGSKGVFFKIVFSPCECLLQSDTEEDCCAELLRVRASEPSS